MDTVPTYTSTPAVQQPQSIYIQATEPQQAYSEKGPTVQSQAIPIQHQPQDPSAQQNYTFRAYKTATPLNVLGRTGAPADCPACGQRNMTRIVTVVGNTNHLYAGIVFLFTGICCFIPYLMDAMKDVEHRCGNCGVLLATVHKSGRVDVHQYH